MRTANYRIPWGRLFVEGGVIVASILFAFAIDAWWESWRDIKAEEAQIARIAEELEFNTTTLNQSIDSMNSAIDATSELLSWMGPTPDESQIPDLSKQFIRMFEVVTIFLARVATDDFLVSGNLTDSDYADFRYKLSQWVSSSDRLFDEFTHISRIRIRLTEYLQIKIPTLHLISGYPMMKRYQASKFPLDSKPVLTDPSMESMIAEYAIRMEVTRINAIELRAAQLELVNLIESY